MAFVFIVMAFESKAEDKIQFICKHTDEVKSGCHGRVKKCKKMSQEEFLIPNWNIRSYYLIRNSESGIRNSELGNLEYQFISRPMNSEDEFRSVGVVFDFMAE